MERVGWFNVNVMRLGGVCLNSGGACDVSRKVNHSVFIAIEPISGTKK